VMNRGRFEQLGDPESLYERPTTRFVAGFLGVSNLLPGTLDGTNKEYATVRLPDDTRVRIPRGLVNGSSRVEVGIRPEKIRLHSSSADAPSGSNDLLGTIIDASYLGVSTQYIVEAGGGDRLTVYEQNVERTNHGSLHRPGERVHLTWSPDNTFVIAGESTSSEADPQ
jgi:spermidine/putrescine transport system ATP-binding protein